MKNHQQQRVIELPGFIVNEDISFVFVNKKACELLGYTRSELLALSVLDVVPDFGSGILTTLSSGYGGSDCSVNIHAYCLTKDQQSLPVEIRISPITPVECSFSSGTRCRGEELSSTRLFYHISFNLGL